MRPPPVVGLCGGIGAGKSTVARGLGALGAVVIDADQAVHEALLTPPVRDALVAHLGIGILGSDGAIDRRAVANRVFGPTSAHTEARLFLEGVVHPAVRLTIEARVAAARAAPHAPPLVVIDAPLLVEGPLVELCDSIVYVDTPPKTRRERTLRDRGWLPAAHDAREAAQAATEKKRARASHCILNDGDREALTGRIQDLFDLLTRPRPPD